jgi:hypothetical protein
VDRTRKLSFLGVIESLPVLGFAERFLGKAWKSSIIVTGSGIRPADRVIWSRSNAATVVKTAMLGNPRLCCVCGSCTADSTLVTEYRWAVQACTPLSTYVLYMCGFSYLVDFDIHLFQIQIHCYKRWHSVDVTLVKNWCFLLAVIWNNASKTHLSWRKKDFDLSLRRAGVMLARYKPRLNSIYKLKCPPTRWD